MQSTLRVGFLVLGLGAGCARDADASGDAPALGQSMADAGRDASVEAEPGGSSGGDMENSGGATVNGGSPSASTAGTMAPAPSTDAGSASGGSGSAGSSGFPGLGGDGGFDPCDIPSNIPGIPGLPEGGFMIPGCP